jgi:hypothetical protein
VPEVAEKRARKGLVAGGSQPVIYGTQAEKSFVALVKAKGVIGLLAVFIYFHDSRSRPG